MDFSGASLRLGAIGADELFNLLDRLDKRAQEVAERIGKRLNDALGEAGKLPGVDQPSSPLKRIPKDAQEAEGSLLHMSHSAAIGLGELGRAFGRMAQSGQAGAFAMREFTGAAMRLAPGGAIAGVSVIAAFTVVELFHSWSKAMDDTKTKMQELAEEHVKLMAEFRGDKVGAEELKLGDEYTKQIKELQNLRPGGFVRAISELITGAGVLTGSSSLLKYGFDLYGGRNLGLDIAQRTADANLLQGDKNAQSEFDRRNASALANANLTNADTSLAKYRAQLRVIETERDNAIKSGELSAAAANARSAAQAAAALREYQKTVWDNAAKFGAEDLESNDNFVKRLAPAWNAMWAKFATDLENAKETKEIAKRIGESTVNAIREETAKSLEQSVTYAMDNFKQFEKAAPLFSPDFWNRLTGFMKPQVTQEIDQLAKWINEQIDTTIGDAIHNGFLRAFQRGGGIGAGIKALTGTLLEGLGQMFVTLGEKMLLSLSLMAAIKHAIEVFLPEVGIPAAIALIALGSAMEAGGAGIAAGGGGSGGYSSGYSSGGTIIDRGTINPLTPASPVANPSSIVARQPVVLNATIIGTRDPVAMRQIQELIAHANARGSV